MAKDVTKLLGDLVEVDFDAISAYDTAINRLEDREAKQRLQEFKADHERHVRDLQATIDRLGGSPPVEGDMKAVLTKGKVALGAMSGDTAILQAMKSNEDETNTAYEEAVEHPDASPEIRELLERNLADERRHRAWLEERLARA